MKTKLYFDIIYNPKGIIDIGNLMSQLDLGISGLLQPKAERISFTTTTKVDRKYIKNISDTIREAYTTTGNNVLSLTLFKKEVIG